MLSDASREGGAGALLKISINFALFSIVLCLKFPWPLNAMS